MARSTDQPTAPAPAAIVVVARLVGATLAYLAVLLSAAAILAYGIGVAWLPNAAKGPLRLVSLGVVQGAALLAVLLIWRLVDRRPIRQLGLGSDRAARRWLRGAAAAALMMAFIILVWFTLLDSAAWDVNPDAIRAALVVVAGLLGFLIQGPAEEILFRGYVLENVLAKWGFGWAVGVSSLTFALLHSLNPHFGLLPLVNLVLFGVATALYKLRFDGGQLWGVFALHTTWNWLQEVVFGLPNSGSATVAENALFTIAPNTTLPDVIWGGGFGPEGTLGASVVLLALIGITFRRTATLQRAS